MSAIPEIVIQGNMMSTDLLEDIRDGIRLTLARFSRDQYHQMIHDGILHDGDTLELIEGTILHKDRHDTESTVTHGGRHLKSLNKLVAVLSQWVADRSVFLQVQGPIALNPQSEPEPDCCLIAGTPDDFGDDVPSGSKVLAVFEVSDSSLAFDRGTKQRLYSKAEIPVYVIVNLKEKNIEVYLQPLPDKSKYNQSMEFHIDQFCEVSICDVGTLAFLSQEVF